MRVILFGDISRWEMAVTLLTEHRPDIQILSLCSLDLGEYINSDATITLREALTLFHNKELDAIININGENPYYFNLLEELGFSPIYVLPSYLVLQKQHDKLSPTESFIYPYKEISPELMQLEFHLADHCNLNCKGCTHFSNLVPKPVFADFNQFKKDITQLSQLFSHIHDFLLLGGEPLLNPDLPKYITELRKTFPYTRIILVTNGLLLTTIKQELISIIKDNHVHISISAYNCLDIEKIKQKIQQHQLSAELRIEKDSFTKFLNPSGSSDGRKIFEQCVRKNCTFLGRGRVAACCLPFVVKYFNAYFDENIPEMESIDLYEPNLTGHAIQQQLITPMKLCNYCSEDISFSWNTSHAPFSKEDWCV